MQLVQWQTPCCVGSPLTDTEAEPQAQRAVRCMVGTSQTCEETPNEKWAS